MAKTLKKFDDEFSPKPVEPEEDTKEPASLTRKGPAILKICLSDNARKNGYIQYDAETGNQWIGDAVIETRLTRFVSSRLGKTLQEA